VHGFQGFELTTFDKEIEKPRMCLQPAVLDAPDDPFQLVAPRARQKGD
jgi:hypothetical protein